MIILEGVKVIDRVQYKDNRGYFSETWKSFNWLIEDGLRGGFRQLNTAESKQNVLRGMHRQDQTKLVMPIYGEIYDVVLNPETREWFGIKLDNTKSLLVPPQYAHGYLVLSETSIVQYIVDKPYNKQLEENFKWNEYGIDWPIKQNIILSEKDS